MIKDLIAGGYGAVGNRTFVVNSQAEMLALQANVGDICVRLDTSESYILQTFPPSILGNWVLLPFNNVVQSVFGRVGNIVAQAGDYTTDFVTESSNLYFTNARSLSAVQKVNNATGYSLAGGTTSKTLTVLENCTLNQNLAVNSSVQFSKIALDLYQNMLYSNGIALFNTVPDYRIGFDNADGLKGYIRYNIDLAGSNSHAHMFSFGSIEPRNFTDVFQIRGDGKIIQNNAGDQGGFNFSSTLKLTNIESPSTSPTNGLFLYTKSDKKLYIKDSDGLESPLLTSAPTDLVTSVFGRVGNVVAQANDYNTSQVTENTNLYFTNARCLSAIEKSNLDTGFGITGGTVSKVLVVSENCNIDQNLSTSSDVQFSKASLSTTLEFNNTTTPGSNPTNGLFLYTKSDKKLYIKDSDGLESPLLTSAPSDLVTSVFGRVGNVVAQAGDYNTSQVTESSNLYFTNARSLSAVQKSNLATGYSLEGGTTSKTLTVLENCTLNQNLSTDSQVQFSEVAFDGFGDLGYNRGLSLYNTFPDYRIGFENFGLTGTVRYNIDAPLSSHRHSFSFGSLEPRNLTEVFQIRGDSKVICHPDLFTNAQLVSGVNIATDINLKLITTPAYSPASNHTLLYFKQDSLNVQDLFLKDSAGNERRLLKSTSAENQWYSIARLQVSDNITLTNIGELGPFKGIQLTDGDSNFKIGFDSVSGTQSTLKYNAGIVDSTNAHRFTFGTIATNETLVFKIRGDGKCGFLVENPESAVDIAGDLMLRPIATPSAPSINDSQKLYIDSTTKAIKHIDKDGYDSYLDASSGMFVPLASGLPGLTLARYHRFVTCDTAVANQSITFNPSTMIGKIFTIKKVNAPNIVTITPNSGTIEGAPNYILSNVYATVTLYCDGTNTFVLNFKL